MLANSLGPGPNICAAPPSGKKDGTRYPRNSSVCNFMFSLAFVGAGATWEYGTMTSSRMKQDRAKS
jgi:hypothetical protein